MSYDPALTSTTRIQRKSVTLLSRSTTSAVAAAITAILVVATFFWLSVDEAASVDGASVLEVGESRYEFVPSVCTFTDTDFIAAGRGSIDGEVFWVSASSRSVSLTVGTDSELQRPAADQLWMTSVGELRWDQGSESLRVRTAMRDGRNDSASSIPARLSVACATST